MIFSIETEFVAVHHKLVTLLRVTWMTNIPDIAHNTECYQGWVLVTFSDYVMSRIYLVEIFWAGLRRFIRSQCKLWLTLHTLGKIWMAYSLLYIIEHYPSTKYLLFSENIARPILLSISVTLTSRHLKSQSTRLFFQQLGHANNNKNSKWKFFLWREFTGFTCYIRNPHSF